MTESNWSITVPITLECIKWSRHTGHGADPLSISLRRLFGITKHIILFSLGGIHMRHKRLSVQVHDCDSYIITHSYELSEGCQEILWNWINLQKITPFKTVVTFASEQREIIIEIQRRHRLPNTGINLLKQINIQ